jgi:uncharacterized RDD family membrane protein YckC
MQSGMLTRDVQNHMKKADNMHCPKCHNETSSAIECGFCGTVFDKHRERIQEPSVSGEQFGSGEYREGNAASKYGNYPTLTCRYIATAIDLIFILAVMILIAYLFENTGETGVKVRAGLVLFLFFVYEPLCTSRFCTLGQKLMRVRVRRYPSRERLSLFMAYIRILVKALLGVLSFFTLPFSRKRRAIHDLAARSIVVFAD